MGQVERLDGLLRGFWEKEVEASRSQEGGWEGRRKMGEMGKMGKKEGDSYG